MPWIPALCYINTTAGGLARWLSGHRHMPHRPVNLSLILEPTKGERREPVLQSCPPTSTRTSWHAHMYIMRRHIR